MHTIHNQAQSVYRALADISRSRKTVIATKSVHRLQICLIVHNQGHPLYNSPKLHPGPCSTVGECGDGQTDKHTGRHTDVTSVHFASSTTRTKCNHQHIDTLEMLQPRFVHRVFIAFDGNCDALSLNISACITRCDRSTVISPNLWLLCTLLLYFISILSVTLCYHTTQ